MSWGLRKGFSWLELLELVFLELSWKGALLGEAENRPKAFLKWTHSLYLFKTNKQTNTPLKREEIYLPIWIPNYLSEGAHKHANLCREESKEKGKRASAGKRTRKRWRLPVDRLSFAQASAKQWHTTPFFVSYSSKKQISLCFEEKKLILQKKHLCSNKNLYINIHRSTIYNC